MHLCHKNKKVKARKRSPSRIDLWRYYRISEYLRMGRENYACHAIKNNVGKCLLKGSKSRVHYIEKPNVNHTTIIICTWLISSSTEHQRSLAVGPSYFDNFPDKEASDLFIFSCLTLDNSGNHAGLWYSHW